MQITTVYLVLRNAIQYIIWGKKYCRSYCCPEISDLRTECVDF